jgi:transcription antitermination factor NusG
MSNIDGVIYLQEVSAKLREGQKVKVKAGPFEGVEGTVIRVKRSRRVMVELPGMLAVATTFVKPEELEVL